ncbi:leucine-rich repeat domain-containing protein, partial [Listeria monocytogenes]
MSNLNDLIVLDLNNNQISDISSLSGLTNLTELWLDKNHISDLSVLANEVKNNASVRISAIGQSVILPKINWSPSLEMPVKVKDTNSEIIPTSISNSGQFVDNGITWTELSNTNQNVAYSWSVDGNVKFSGTATTEVTPIALRILLDDDGNSQTPEDQTLFAEEASNINYLEDIYNYAKEKLSGTDYGLVDIQEDSNGFYKIIVSKVGSLKTEDVNGDSIETDKAYTPTYTVTGTKNKAQLNASYGVTVDSSPGYVYIYEKNTPQEVRYGAGANINMPLTDTNGNGKPQWQENYTIVQYKKAGDLTPTLQDGSQVPGGNISIPNDAVAGDLVAVPDKITGSDGKEYGVDPKVVDVDPNAPGVQIKLTEDEQDIPYLDIVLSESESTSLSESESTSLSESESTSLSESESESTSLSESESTSLSESESTSLSESESTSLSESESTSLSESESTSLSESESTSLSESESTSLSESESTSLSESESTSLSESESTSLSESESTSLSESESTSLSESESTSLSESESTSLSESESTSLSESESTSLSESESISLSESESTSLSESESTSLSESES